jgi:hypothetical protein
MNGRLEYWNIGMIETCNCCVGWSFRLSSLPLFQSSIIPFCLNDH